MQGGFDRDPHSQAGQPCPKNFFELTDYQELSKLERVYAQRRTVDLLLLGVTGRFDTAHLQGIHRYLFQDVFPWAGEFRVVGISKQGGAPFAAPQFITSALEDLFAKLRAENYLRRPDKSEFARCAAFYLGEINAVHPFREGNGRTQREFIRQLALQAGHVVSWAGFTQEQMTVASILSHTRADHTELASIIQAAIQPATEP